MHQRKPTPTDCTHPQERSPQRRRALLLCAAIAIPLASCQPYEPQPLDPDASLAAWEARNYDPDDLHHSPGAIWLKKHLGLEPFDDLGDDGTLAKSTLLLFAYNPDIRIARAAVEQARALDEVPLEESHGRRATLIGELDRVLGGGLVPGSVHSLARPLRAAKS